MSRQPVPTYPEGVNVIRSARRKRTIQARVVKDTVVVRVPAGMDPAEEQAAVAEVLAKVRKKTSSSALSDEELGARARTLNRTLLGGKADFSSIRWVGNQNTRWGSCSVGTGEIRISDRLQHVPDYVLNSVIVHELVHTFIPGHTEEFYQWASKAPHYEKSLGYLEAYQRWGDRR